MSFTLTVLDVTVNTSKRERPIYIGLTGLSWGSGFILGPIIGGVFAERATWRWAFYLNLVLFAVFAPILFILLPRYDPLENMEITVWSRVKGMDWLGSLLEIGGILLLIMGISFGGTILQWTDYWNIGIFGGSVVLFILFSVQQSYQFMTDCERRIFPVQFVNNKDLVLLWIIAAACGLAMLVSLTV
jgi:MFS family permease